MASLYETSRELSELIAKLQIYKDAISSIDSSTLFKTNPGNFQQIMEFIDETKNDIDSLRQQFTQFKNSLNDLPSDKIQFLPTALADAQNKFNEIKDIVKEFGGLLSEQGTSDPAIKKYYESINKEIEQNLKLRDKEIEAIKKQEQIAAAQAAQEQEKIAAQAAQKAAEAFEKNSHKIALKNSEGSLANYESDSYKNAMASMREYYKEQEKAAEQAAKVAAQAAQEQEKIAAQAAQKEIEEAKEVERIKKESVQNRQKAITNIISLVGKVAQVVNQVVNSVIAAIRKVISIVNTAFSTISKVFTTIKNSSQRLLTLFANFGKGLEQVFNNETLKLGENLYQSIVSLSNIIGPELTANTIEWANALKGAFGLSAKGLLSDINELSGVIYGLGINKKDVSQASEDILAMGNYLAFTGLAGGNASTAVNKMTSGLMGMTRAVAGLGISLKESSVNSWLRELKKQGGVFKDIGTDLSALNAEQKVYVEYAYMLKQFNDKYNIGNFKELLETPTGQLAQIRNMLNDLRITIGQVFVEFVGVYGKYIIWTINQITEALNRLYAKLNEKHKTLDINNETNDANKVVNDVNNSLEETEDTINDIDSAAKKATKSLYGFDKVTKLGNNTNTSVFDYSSLVNEFKHPAEELEKIANVTEDRIKEIGTLLEEEIGKRIKGFSFDGVISALFNKDTFDSYYNNAEGNWKNILGILNSVGKIARTLWNDIIKPLLQDFGKFGKNEFLPWLNEQLEKLGAWISEHKDDIIHCIEVFANFAWESFKVFVDLLAKAMEYIIMNPESVVNGLKILLGLKIGAFFLGLVGSIAKTVLEFSALSTIAGGAGAGLSGFGGIAALTAPKILLIVAAVAAVIAIITELWNKSEGFRNFVISAGKAIGTILESLWHTITNFIDDISDALSNFFDNIFKNGLGFFESLGILLVEALGSILDIIGTFGSDILSKIVGFFNEGLANSIKEGWENLRQWFKDAIQTLIQLIKDLFGIHSPSKVMSDIGENIMQGLWDGLKAKWDNLKNWWAGIKDTLAGWWQSAKDFFTPSWSSNLSVSMSSAQISSFAGFRASGGVIPRGSVIVGNEGGRLEMYGQMPGGQSVAVNNRMITDAISQAVERAMLTVLSQNSMNTGNVQVDIHNDGLTVYDDATIETVARKLKTALESI